MGSRWDEGRPGRGAGSQRTTGASVRGSGYGYNAQGYNLRGASQGYVRDHNGYDRNGYPVQGGSVRRDRNGRPVYAQPPAPLGSLGSLGRQRVPMGGISLDDGRSGRSGRRPGSARGAGGHPRRRGTARRDAAARPRSGEPTVGGVRILPVIALLILVLAIAIAIRGLAGG